MGLLSRLGIGAATVEPALHAPRIVAGDPAPVRVTIQGGSDGQRADRLLVRLVTEADTDDGTEPVSLAETTVATDLHVAPETDREFAATLDVPVWAPYTASGTEVLLSATLTMDWAREPTGRTEVAVDPGPRLDRALAALAELGIQVDRTRPLATTQGVDMPGTDTPGADTDARGVQRFECHPHSGAYVGRITQLTIVAVVTEAVLTLHLDTDVSSDTVYAATDAYERFATVEVTNESVPTLRRRFERALGTGTTSDPSPGV